MNAVTKLLATSAIALFAVAGAHAEEYEGVHPLTTERTRAELQNEARAATQNFTAFGDLTTARVHAPGHERVRPEVRAEAVDASKHFQAFGDAAGMGVM